MSSDEITTDENGVEEADDNVDLPKKKEKENVANKSKKNKVKTKGSRKNKLDHPKTIEMIVEAIEDLQEPKGSSVQSIKSFILDNYKVRDDMIKCMMKRAFITGIKNNVVARPPDQANSSMILCGRYLIAKQAPESTEPPKPRLSKLRQLGAAKPQKKKKKKRKGFY